MPDARTITGVWSDVYTTSNGREEGPEPRIKTASSLIDPSGNRARISMSGAQVHAETVDEISINFANGLSIWDVDWDGALSGRTLTTGTGSVTASLSRIAVSSGTGVGTGYARSLDTVRYVSGNESFVQFSCVFGNPKSRVDQYAGFYTAADAACFGFDGTRFGIWHINAGASEFTPQSEWTHDRMDGTGPSGVALNPLGMRVYRVSFTWHGGLPQVYSVWGGASVGFVVVHVDETGDSETTPHLAAPTLPMAMVCTRGEGSGDAVTMYSSSWQGGIIGGPNELGTARRVFNYEVLQYALHLRSKRTFGGRENGVKSQAYHVTFASEGNKPVLFSIYNALTTVIDGTPTFIDRSLNSITEYSTENFGVTPLLPFSEGSYVLPKIGNIVDDITGQGFYIYPGAQVVIAAESSGASDVSMTLRLVELW